MWYGSGTIQVAANGTTATGTGTQFIGNVRVGDGIAIQGSATLHEVTGVTSNTQLSFSPPYAGTAGSGKAFRIVPVLGYDKDLSDAFNALRLQFGDQLSNLQPWATAPTQDAAQTALGMSASGKAVATGTPAQGRTALGLGTAATAYVTTSSTDKTAGRLLQVGAFGLGGTGFNIPPEADLNDYITTGFYKADTSAIARSVLNSPVESAFGLTVLPVGAYSSTSSFQILKPFDSRSIWTRYANNGAWSDWMELLHTGNTGTAAKRDVTTSGVDTTAGRLLKVGDFGLGSVLELTGVSDLNDIRRPGFYGWRSSTPENAPNSYSSMIVSSWGNNSCYQMFFRDSFGVAFRILQSPSGTWSPLYTLRGTNNTTVDSNGFIKSASPIIKLHSDRRETEADGAFERLGTGHYRLTGCNGLRLTDGWYIETPHDRNGNKYFNVEWEQDHEPDAEAGVLDEPADVTLTIRCYERVWNATTGQFDNGDPVDIPDGRWIDLRMNEVRQSEPDIPEEEADQPAPPSEPDEPVIPSVVTMAQAKLALLYAGLFEAAEQYINELPEPHKTAALIEWNHRQTLEREHPLVRQVADGLGLTEQQLDELFLDASTR